MAGSVGGQSNGNDAFCLTKTATGQDGQPEPDGGEQAAGQKCYDNKQTPVTHTLT